MIGVVTSTALPKVELIGMSGGEIVQDNVEICRQEAMRFLGKKKKIDSVGYKFPLMCERRLLLAKQ